MQLILIFYLGLGAVVTIQGPRDIASDMSTLLIVIAVHIALIAFAVFAYVMARKQATGKFLGFSPVMWPVAAAISYVVGLVAPYFFV